MSKIRVVHVGLSDNVGGIETVVKSWNDRLSEDIAFDFIKTTETIAFEDDFMAKGSRVYKIPSRKQDPKGSKKAMEDILRQGSYDYLHFHAMSLSWPEPVVAAANCGVQGIIHSHMVVDDNMSLKYRFLHKIGKAVLKKFNYLELACGEQAGKSMFGNDKFTFIPNGIELNKFKYSQSIREKIRNDLQISDDEFVIGNVGRPGPQKNYPFIFETFASLMKKTPKCKLLLIGNLQNDPEVHELIKKFGCKEKTILTGCICNVNQMYSAMDCFFFPSLYEGFSIALIEAQAAGLPCVASINVAEESKLTDSFSFVNIDSIDQALSELEICKRASSDRTITNSIYNFDIAATSERIFNYYRTHINRQEIGVVQL